MSGSNSDTTPLIIKKNKNKQKNITGLFLKKKRKERKRGSSKQL